jgi:DinB superfamily
MIEVKNPYKKDALLKSFEDTHSGVTSYFSSLAQEDFFRKVPDKWSAAENLIHLIKSVKAVLVGVRLPKMLIGLKFGKSERNSRIYPQIRDVYLNRLAEGALTVPKFRPDDRQETSDHKVLKEQVLKKWDEVCGQLTRKLNRWKEKDLDIYILPHPILGHLTVRETIMITIYHNIHHLTNVQKFLGDS